MLDFFKTKFLVGSIDVYDILIATIYNLVLLNLYDFLLPKLNFHT